MYEDLSEKEIDFLLIDSIRRCYQEPGGADGVFRMFSDLRHEMAEEGDWRLSKLSALQLLTEYLKDPAEVSDEMLAARIHGVLADTVSLGAGKEGVRVFGSSVDRIDAGEPKREVYVDTLGRLAKVVTDTRARLRS